MVNFNPRAPCGARPKTPAMFTIIEVISTHAPLAGRDGCTVCAAGCCVYFNPRAPCGARPAVQGVTATSAQISTHAPLAGRDTTSRMKYHSFLISTHAPLAGRDTFLACHRQLHGAFQPTRPLRGAT